MSFILPLGIILYFLIISELFSKLLKLTSFEKPIFSCGILVLILNYFYFIFSLSLNVIFYLILGLLIISSIFLLIQKKTLKKDIFEIIATIIPILFFFQLIFYFYGEQFFIFRGNQQDTFVYLSTGLTFFENNYQELLNLKNEKEFFTDNKYYLNLSLELIEYRPSVGLMIGLMNNFKFIDLIVVGYIFKILCTCLTIYACSEFFSVFKKNKFENIILSYVFVLSIFYFYNFEIDAFSLIFSIPFLILSLKFLIQIMEQDKSNSRLLIIKYFLMASIFFIIYPNGAAIFIVPTSIIFIFIIFKNKSNSIFLKNIIIGILFFLLIILPTYNTTILYLISEVKVGLTHRPDYWGYYGAFILGKDNPIHDREFVNLIKNLILINNNFFEIVKIIIYKNLENSFLFFLNLIPSIFGFYHFTTSSSYGLYNYLLVPLLIYLNYYLIKNLILNFYNIMRAKTDYFFLFKIFIIYFLLFFLYLIFSSNLWSSIKLYFIYSIIIFVIVFFQFKENRIKPKFNLVIILLVMLPFYKYSVYNHGIGVLDSFPSIIKKQNKIGIEWTIDKNKLSKCKNIKLEINEFRKKIYISMLHNNIEKKNSEEICSVYEKDKKFGIEIL